MSTEYAPRGFIGMLAPQANTAVESECAILLPAGVGLLAGRLTSARPTIEERLVEYIETLETSVQQFGGTPLRALGFACTGASYLAGRQREGELFERLSRRLECTVTSSALAVVDALNALSARDIALVSPYPESLTLRSVGYWESYGFKVRAVSRLTGDASGTAHPIYGLGSEAALQATLGLRGQAFDAVVMLGTGMPTLRAILACPRVDGAPVFSCTLALAWRCVRALEGAECSAASLLEWVGGWEWKARLQARTPQALP
jgi:maleate cis-trans isomerase